MDSYGMTKKVIFLVPRNDKKFHFQYSLLWTLSFFHMYIFKYAFKNIVRNPFISLSSIVVIGLLIFFINILTLVLFSTEKFINSVNDRISITIPFQSGYTDESLQTQKLFYTLSTSFPDIQSLYISQEEAFTLFQSRNPDLAKLIESTDENPLPNSLRLSWIPLGSYEAIEKLMAEYRDILEYNETEFNRKLIDFQSQYSRIESLVKILRLLAVWVYTLLGLFVFTVFVVLYTVISNTIFFLRDEMSIIELVGGRSYFIYGPLVIQWVFYTGMAVFLAVWVFYSLPFILPLDSLPSAISLMISEFYIFFSEKLAYGILAAIILGMLSSFIASWKYVHKTIG